MGSKISLFIKNLISTYDVSPYDINNGLCEDFMKKVTHEIDLAEECCTGFVLENDYMKYPIHVWIYYDGKHYDAETPHGVTDWSKLPFFSNVNINKNDIKNNKFTN